MNKVLGYRRRITGIRGRFRCYLTCIQVVARITARCAPRSGNTRPIATFINPIGRAADEDTVLLNLVGRLAIVAAVFVTSTTSASAQHLVGGTTPSTFAEGLLSGIGQPFNRFETTLQGLDRTDSFAANKASEVGCGSPIQFIGKAHQRVSLNSIRPITLCRAFDA